MSNQSGAAKGQSVPVVKKEVQVLRGDSQQTIGQEGNMPDPVSATADSSSGDKAWV